MRHSIIWTLIDKTDTLLVSSFPKGFDTKREAQRNVEAVCFGLTGGQLPPAWAGCAPGALREVGPGRKPE